MWKLIVAILLSLLTVLFGVLAYVSDEESGRVRHRVFGAILEENRPTFVSFNTGRDREIDYQNWKNRAEQWERNHQDRQQQRRELEEKADAFDMTFKIFLALAVATGTLGLGFWISYGNQLKANGPQTETGVRDRR